VFLCLAFSLNIVSSVLSILLLQMTGFHSSLIYVYFVFVYNSLSIFDGLIGWFYILVIMNSAVINIGVQESLWKDDFIYLGYNPGNWDAGQRVVLFSVSREIHIALPDGYTDLHSHQLCGRVPLFPQPCFFDNSLLLGVRGYFIVVLICIWLMISDAEHFFHIPAGHLCIVFWEMFIQIFFVFLIGFFAF
jgi:hypothetical protein